MPCSVCNHPQRRAIDLALLSRTATLAQLSREHRLSTSALHRHKQHLQHKTAAAQSRFRNLLREGSLIILSSLLERLLKITANAEAEGNATQVLQGTRQSTDIIKLMHKLELDLGPDSLYRLLESPQWADQDSLLPPISALTPLPARPWLTISAPPVPSLTPLRLLRSNPRRLRLFSPTSPACVKVNPLLPGGKKVGNYREKLLLKVSLLRKNNMITKGRKIPLHPRPVPC